MDVHDLDESIISDREQTGWREYGADPTLTLVDVVATIAGFVVAIIGIVLVS
jgi:hypothetical protein